MKAKIPGNPFFISGYHGPEYFCDREKETRELIEAARNGRNVTLIGPRRMGKSGLIKNVFHKLGEEGGIRCAYADILGTQNLSEFVKVFSSAVFSSFETSIEKVSRAATSFLRGFRPTFTIDPMGTHTYSFDVSPSFAEATLSGVFDYLESRKFPTLIAIDEFQQVAFYPEKGTEALLRSRIQFLTNSHFIFSGSQQHLMGEMFASAKRPFYNSTQFMQIVPIDDGRYFDFAAGHFNNAGMTLDRPVFDSIYRRFDGITWYVQAVLNQLYGNGGKRPTADDADEAINYLVAGSAYEFESILNACPDGAVRLLKAIAKEGCVAEITGGDFIAKYNLKAASSVSAALKTLKNADLVYHTPSGYVVYDRLFGIWLSRLP